MNYTVTISSFINGKYKPLKTVVPEGATFRSVLKHFKLDGFANGKLLKHVNIPGVEQQYFKVNEDDQIVVDEALDFVVANLTEESESANAPSTSVASASSSANPRPSKNIMTSRIRTEKDFASDVAHLDPKTVKAIEEEFAKITAGWNFQIKGVKLVSLFKTTHLKLALVMATDAGLFPDLLHMADGCEQQLLDFCTNVIATIYPTFEFRIADIKNLVDELCRVTASNVFRFFVAKGRGPLDQNLQKRRSRLSVSLPTQKGRKRSTVGASASEESISSIISKLKSAPENEVYEMYKKSGSARFQWIKSSLWTTPNDSSVFGKLVRSFPRILQNVKFLDGDFEALCNASHPSAVPVSDTLRSRVDSLIWLSDYAADMLHADKDAREQEAVRTLVGLLSHHSAKSRRKICGDPNIIFVDVRIDVTPAVFADTCPDPVVLRYPNGQYYCVVDRIPIAVDGTLADALEGMVTIFYILNYSFPELTYLFYHYLALYSNLSGDVCRVAMKSEFRITCASKCAGTNLLKEACGNLDQQVGYTHCESTSSTPEDSSYLSVCKAEILEDEAEERRMNGEGDDDDDDDDDDYEDDDDEDDDDEDDTSLTKKILLVPGPSMY